MASEGTETVQVDLTQHEIAVLYFAAREFRNQVWPRENADLETGLQTLLHKIWTPDQEGKMNDQQKKTV